MNSLREALGLVFAMGAVILFCRAFPFLFFSGKNSGEAETENNIEPSRKKVFFTFVEKTVPPVAMTVLAFNALGTSFRDNPRDGLLVLGASLFTALIHLWKHNPLVSIFGGTALYMVFLRIFT